MFSIKFMLKALLQYPLHKIKIRCPAFIFASNRTDNVNGRTIILTNSTMVKKGFNSIGAPPGKNLAKVIPIFVKILDRIKNLHKGNAKVNTKIAWLL